jgi:hypothetical protein
MGAFDGGMSLGEPGAAREAEKEPGPPSLLIIHLAVRLMNGRRLGKLGRCPGRCVTSLGAAGRGPWSEAAAYFLQFSTFLNRFIARSEEWAGGRK